MDDRRWSWRTLAPIAVAAAVVLPGLDRWTLWQDEAFTWLQAWRTPAQLVQGAAQDRHPPLYYLVVKAFTAFGDTDGLLRLPSALAVIGAVALAAVVRPGGSRIAAWVIALTPAALLYGWTARMYALLLFFGTLLWVSGCALAEGRRRVLPWIGLALGASGILWTHYAGIAAVAAAGLGTALGVLARQEGWKDRGIRWTGLVVAFALAGVSFLPWALGPLQFQLANKDAPADRTLAVLRYLGWGFDSRIPAWSWLVAGLQLAGLGFAVRRSPLGWFHLGWAAVAVLAPWWMSKSEPAQNPRNYLDLLPGCAGLVALVAARPWPERARWLGVGVFALAAADPLVDLYRRPVSPQEPGVGFDYAVEADVFDASIPPNAGLHFRPGYLATRFERYAPGLTARTKVPPGPHSWLVLARAEWVDSTVLARYPTRCTFQHAFRNVVYAPEGPGCDAVLRWIEAVSDDRPYVPFLHERARRALAAGDLETAEALTRRAAGALRANPAMLGLLGELRVRRGDGAGALEAADAALAVARAWHHGNGPIADAWNLRAQALALLGDEAGAESARELGRCARRHPFPTACGAWWGRLLPEMEPMEAPAPSIPPLPPLSEPQAARPPEAAPAGATRRELWGLDGEVLPVGWVDAQGSPVAPTVTMDTVDDAVVLVAAVEPAAPVAVACGPLVDAAPHLAVRARWRTELAPGEGRATLQLEARYAGTDGATLRLAGVPITDRPLRAGGAVPWRVDRVDFRPPPAAAKVRLCVKAEGQRPARFVLDWAELLVVEDG